MAPSPRRGELPAPARPASGASQEALVCMFLEAASIALTLAMRSCGRHGFRELPARTRGACGVAWGSGADPHGWVHAGS